jgi:hypothetical protein
MHLKTINITDSFSITNRGTVLTTDLDYDTEHHHFNQGDTFDYDDKIYEILSIEALLKVDGYIRRDVISFIVKETKNN